MFLSHLMIDVGDNPDRPRPGRLWLRNIYHVHQRISMGFPSQKQCEEDPLFLRSFDPAGFDRPHFLFRIDNSIEESCPRAVILVQSDLRPNWDYAFQNARMFLAAPPEIRAYTPIFPVGREFRFRIHINLSKKSATHRKTSDRTDAEGRVRTQGKRIAFSFDKEKNPDDAVREWFASKGSQLGFALHEFRLLRLGWVAGYQSGKDRNIKFRSALLDGTLAVIDVSAFEKAVSSGIGSAKAFGFGLLSLAPLK